MSILKSEIVLMTSKNLNEAVFRAASLKKILWINNVTSGNGASAGL